MTKATQPIMPRSQQTKSAGELRHLEKQQSRESILLRKVKDAQAKAQCRQL